MHCDVLRQDNEQFSIRKRAIIWQGEIMSSTVQLIVSILVATSVFGLLLWKKGSDCLP